MSGEAPQPEGARGEPGLGEQGLCPPKAGTVPVPEPAERASALVRRITDRLSVDPELRLEVARELRTHLEDCAADFRAGGACEEEARASAEKALGDPGELADQLWQANRGRLRFRAVVRWAARLTLLPGAIATVLVLSLGMLILPFSSLLSSVESLHDVSWPVTQSKETDFILRGDPGARNHVEREKSIADRWPDNPVYYGNYVLAVSNSLHDPERTAAMAPLLARAERIDPGNCYYDLCRASHLFASSIELSTSEPASQTVSDSNIALRPAWDYVLRVKDGNLFEMGLQEFREAADKPLFANRTADMLALRLNLLPKPRSVRDVFHRIALSSDVPDVLMLGQYRQLARIICTHAVGLAEKGDANALFWARSALRVSDRIGAQATTVLETLTARAYRALALIAQERIGRSLGDDAASGEANAAYLAMERTFRLWHGTRTSPAAMRHAGLYWHWSVGLIPGESEVDFEPLRTAEAWAVLQGALAAVLAAVVVVALTLGGMTLWSRLRRREEGSPVLLFVGWRRLGTVCLLSIVIPLGCYALYARWQFTGSDAYGLNYTGGRVFVELAAIASSILLLLLGMSSRAIRMRAVEVGLDAPPPLTPRRRPFVTAMCLAGVAAALAYVVGWWAGPFRHEVHAPQFTAEEMAAFMEGFWPPLVPMVLGSAVAGIAVIVILREFVGLVVQRRFAPFRRALCRSLIPVVCAAVILIGTACGLSLSWGERLASQRITGNAWMDISNEMEKSGYRALRREFVKWCQEDAQRAVPEQTPTARPSSARAR